MASQTGALTAVGSVTLEKTKSETAVFIALSGTHGLIAAKIEGSADGATFTAIPYFDLATGRYTLGDVAVAANTNGHWRVPSDGYSHIRIRITSIASGQADVTLNSQALTSMPLAVLVSPVQYFPGNAAIGGSTAAAGSTTSDATVLPAATAKIYPTTAADGTKGVRIHADDKADGNVLVIGNGVSNQILKVYPPSGGTINGAAADAAYSSASGKSVMIWCTSAASNTWQALG